MRGWLGFIAILVGCGEPAPVTPSDLFISDYAADAIFRFDGSTGEPLEVFAAGSDQRVDRPANVQVGPDGNIYAAGFGRAEIVRYDRATGAMMDVFFRDTVWLEEPVELAFHGEELLVLGNDTANLVVIDRDGRPTRELGYPLMRDAHDFVLAGDRVIVGTDSSPTLGHAIQIWDLVRGELVASFGTPAEVATATAVALDGDTLYVADWESSRVAVFSLTGQLERFIPADHPISLDFGPDGRLYILQRDGLYADGERVVGDPRFEYPRGFRFVSR